MVNFFKNINMLFECKLGWFFINGRKIERWNEYIKSKYKSKY